MSLTSKRQGTSSASELAQFREVFNLADRDGGGSINRKELRELFVSLGIDASSKEITMMVDEFDKNGDGEIGFDEFVAAISRKIDPSYTMEQIMWAFRVFEKEEENVPSGHVRLESLSRALAMYSNDGKLTVEEAQELVHQLEPDQGGMINYATYVETMMRR